MEAEITVQYRNYPKEGKKLGSIKSSEGTYYWALKDTLSVFQPGEVCKIEYDEDTDKNGKVWKRIKRKISSTPTVMQKPPVQYPRARTSPADSEQIFVVALLKETYTKDTGAVELLEEINKLRKVWRNSFGGSETQRDDEMRDEIPY